MDIKYEIIEKKMLLSGSLKNASALSRALGVTPQALSNCKRKGTMPTKLVFRFAELFKVSLDWLLNDGADAEPIYLQESVFEGEGSLKPEEILLPEERKYIGKLLRILKHEESKASKAIKQSIDIIDRELGDDKSACCEQKASQS